MEASEIIKEIREEKNGLVISSNYKLIQASRGRLKEIIKRQIIFSKPIITREGIGIIYPNTISTIQGKSGVHKSRLTENLCCCLLTKVPEKSYLGYSASSDEKFTVLYVDTERNQSDQFPYALQKIVTNSGFPMESEIANFDFISLVEISREERFEALKDYLSNLRKTNKNHIVIILDVLTDIIKNFNDPNESLKLIDLMNMMINQSNVTFIGIIHENPNGNDKARGHLGTEIFNKSSTVMQIGFEKDKKNNNTDLIKVSYLKCRSTRRLEDFYLVYSDVTNGLELAEGELINDILDARKSKANIIELKKFLAQTLHTPLSKDILFENIKAEFECSYRIIEDRLKQLVNSKELFNNKFGFESFLTKYTENRKVVYALHTQKTNPNTLL
ncbi:MAG: hypothetical protein IPP32_16390 [Bacteroidetes bacterium]|nr:hypothetical protein [Bacteroidota bacterium]